jgi:D-glycero-beta-D-manno-heptose 1-phosphate adenylyltransferase
VKGADWAPNEVVGREEVEAAGGRVVTIPLASGYSTSNLLEKIRRSLAAAKIGTAAPHS